MEELEANLQRLGSRASRVENKALRSGATVLQEAIKMRAPRSTQSRSAGGKGNTWRTGEHFADHIGVSKVRSMGGTKYILVGVEKTDNSKYFYAKFIEFGTSKMTARPFMEPAANESHEAIVTAMADVVRAELKL